MASMKLIQQSDGKTVHSPVVLRVTLTQEQSALIARYTGKFVRELELSQEELQLLTGGKWGHGPIK